MIMQDDALGVRIIAIAEHGMQTMRLQQLGMVGALVYNL